MNYDVIVIGTGGVGSAALWQLAKRGLRVLGLEQFPQAHANGSSHGQSRIIRQAYFEHANYVPLLRLAYDLWDEVQLDSGRKLFHPVGLLEVGPSDGVLIPGIRQSVEQHGIPVQWLTDSEARAEFPMMIPDGMVCAFEPTAGYLLVEQCVQTHLDLAIRDGASWQQDRVVDWTSDANGVEVITEQARYLADRLVICGGAWSATLLADLNIQLQVLPKHQYWFAPKADSKSAASMPTYFYELDNRYFYGFPAIDDRGLKVAQHSGGTPTANPVSLQNLTDEQDERLVYDFATRYCPLNSGKLLSQQACMYTMSPDEHFIVDVHPLYERVCFATGMSGHGFKFTPALGQALADLATNQIVQPNIDFLGLKRFSTA